MVGNVLSAIVAALVMAGIYTTFGYGDAGGGTVHRFFQEVVVALAGYYLAARLTQMTPDPENFMHDVYCISFIGSTVHYLLTLILIDNQNSIRWIIAEVSREHSLRPIIYLFSFGLSYVIVASIISFPLIAATLWLWSVHAKTANRH